MGRPTRFVATAAVAALGALIVHQLAYLLAFPMAAARDLALANHGHLATQATLTTPLAALAAAGFILGQLRRSSLEIDMSRRSLCWFVTGFFVVQETIEAALTDGWVSVATNPAVHAGMVLAPLVALVIYRVLRQAADLASRLLAPPQAVTPPSKPILRPVALTWQRSLRHAGSSPRGPPR